MSGRVFFVISILLCGPSYAPPITINRSDCPLETAAEEPPRDSGRLPSSNLKDDVPFPIAEVVGAFTPQNLKEMRAAMRKMGLDLEPGREYLQDAENAVHAFDQWKADYDNVLKNPELKKEAERVLLSYLHNPPPQFEGKYNYHPGLMPERPLQRKESLDDYFTDADTRYKLGIITRTLENTLEFRSVLEADTFQDPGRRSRYISQMRTAYFVIALVRERIPVNEGPSRTLTPKP